MAGYSQDRQAGHFQPQPPERHSPTFYSDLAENAVVAMHCVDSRGRIIWANRAELEMLGYEAEQYIGHHLHEFHADLVCVEEMMSRLTAGEELREFEARMRRADGSFIHVALSSSGFFKNGKLEHSRCFTREISRQRQLEINLREYTHQLERSLNRNESLLAQLDSLLEASPTGIAFLDTRLRYVRMNRALAALQCTPVEAHLGLRPHEVLASGGEELEAIYQRVLQTRRPELRELNSALWGDKQARTVVCSAYPVLTPDYESLGVGVTLVDISEQRKVAHELAATQERLHQVVHAAPIFMWAVDKDGRFLFAEGAGMAGLGLKSGDLTGVSAFERFGHLPEIAALKRALQGEAGFVTPKVGDAWFDVNLMPTFEKDGSVSGAFGVGIDVTARMVALEKQRELEKTLDRNRRMESMRVMAGGVGHDLNNLLTAILGNVNLGLMRLPASSAARYNLELIETAARNASELAREMLACGGRNPPQLAPLDINRLLDSLGGLMDLSFGGRIRLLHEFSPMLPAIMGDSGQLGRVIISLTRNAAEAIGERGGTIELSTGLVELEGSDLAAYVGNESLKPGPYVFIDITDDGCGMNEQVRENLFRPFYTTKQAGSGLSMAAALGIVHAHGGAISVESAPMRGTRLRLLFPVTNDAVRDTEPVVAAHSTHPIKPGTKIMVVDDNEAVRQVATMILEDLKLVPIVAKNGPESLELYRAHFPEIALVILDLMMPGMSGDEVFERLRQFDPKAKVVISTGYGEREFTHRFEVRSVAGFLPKPYSPSMVRDILASVLKSGATGENS